ncbi:hypothetical protein [Aliarcobacter butzleri]|uniref:hypothetical protein n=1 Tax=Aliarcobacter butzleri TaxID=28197 RepID=UPI00126A5169|nr:hypothetical protein [Aliarcobacter butzleri]
MHKKFTSIISYKQMFSIEEISIIDNFLDTKEAKEDNTFKSYIKINLEKLKTFIETNINDFIKEPSSKEAVEFLLPTIKEYSNNFEYLRLR